MIFKQETFNKGLNVLTEENGKHSENMMDIEIFNFDKGDSDSFFSDTKESAFLLLDGQVTMKFDDKSYSCKRSSLFDEKPTCLHVPKGVKVTIDASSNGEILIQKTTNNGEFTPVFYSPDDIKEVILGDDVWYNTARRVLRDIFTYDNAPYSNMVMGEIINLSGRFSSYPPHHHRQPEVYYYRFDKPQGFGCSMIGEEMYKITDRSFSTIPGGLCHPQVAAPGYPMYYCWMIRHFEGDPWTERIFDPEHEWLLDANAKVWEPKK